MKFVILVLLLFPAICVGATFEEHVNYDYPSVVNKLEQCGFKGPIAKDLAKYALVRQVHENGTDRSPDYSIPGIGCGGWNHEFLMDTVNVFGPHLKVGRITDSEGMRMYVLKGPEATQVSTVTIARLFDHYVERFNFSKQDKDTWQKSKVYSYILHCDPKSHEYWNEYRRLTPAREKIIKRCNKMYGPGGDRIEGQVKKLEPLFTQW
jgi:hypothetical protein